MASLELHINGRIVKTVDVFPPSYSSLKNSEHRIKAREKFIRKHSDDLAAEYEAIICDTGFEIFLIIESKI